MPARMLVYYSDLLKKYLAKQQIELTSGSLRRLPAPKFFVIYTGSGYDDVCEQHLTAAFGEEADLQGPVPIVRSGPPGSILEQYITFCHLYQEQKKRFSKPKDIVQNTIKIRVERGILVDFLTAHAAEVEEVMEQQFNQEQIFERIRQEDRQEGRQEGRQLGLVEGQEKTMVSNLHQLMCSMGWSAEQAMTALGIVDGNRQKYGKLLQSTH